MYMSVYDVPATSCIATIPEVYEIVQSRPMFIVSVCKAGQLLAIISRETGWLRALRTGVGSLQ